MVKPADAVKSTLSLAQMLVEEADNVPAGDPTTVIAGADVNVAEQLFAFFTTTDTTSPFARALLL